MLRPGASLHTHPISQSLTAGPSNLTRMDVVQGKHQLDKDSHDFPFLRKKSATSWAGFFFGKPGAVSACSFWWKNMVFWAEKFWDSDFFCTVEKGWKLPTGKKRCEIWGRDWICNCSGCCCWYIDIYIYIYARLKSRSGKHWREMKSLSL